MTPLPPSARVAIVQARVGQQIGDPARVFDGTVPDELPEDERGFILSYVVLFAGVGSDLPAERDLSQLAALDVTSWTIQTQCVGASPANARDCAHDVQQALTGLPLGAGWLKPDEDSFAVSDPIPDYQTTPVRFYIPLRWRLTTT